MDSKFYTESFQEFSSKVGPLDLALYAGVGLIIWVLFQDKLSGIKPLFASLVDKFKTLFAKSSPNTTPVFSRSNNEDIFFSLVSSWKQFRDLAEQSGCTEAVKAADQLFPYLSPNVCSKKETQV